MFVFENYESWHESASPNWKRGLGIMKRFKSRLSHDNFTRLSVDIECNHRDYKITRYQLNNLLYIDVYITFLSLKHCKPYFWRLFSFAHILLIASCRFYHCFTIIRRNITFTSFVLKY